MFLKICMQLILVMLFLPRYNHHDEKSAKTSRNQGNNFIGYEQSDRVIRSFIENLCNSMINLKNSHSSIMQLLHTVCVA